MDVPLVIWKGSSLDPFYYMFSCLSCPRLFLSPNPYRSAVHPADIKVTVWSEVTCAECAEQSYNGATPVVACAGDEAGASTPPPSSGGVGVGSGDDDKDDDGGNGNGDVVAPTAPPTTVTVVVDGEKGLLAVCTFEVGVCVARRASRANSSFAVKLNGTYKVCPDGASLLFRLAYHTHQSFGVYCEFVL